MSHGTPYITNDKASYSVEQILKKMILEDANGSPFVKTSSDVEAHTIVIEFNTDMQAEGIVADVTSVSDWNTFFNLPIKGTEFTSVLSENGNTKFTFVGGNYIYLSNGIFFSDARILSIVDDGAIHHIETDALNSCTNLHTLSFAHLESLGDYALVGCGSLVNINLPEAITIGNYALSTLDVLVSLNLPKVQTMGIHAVESNVSLQEVLLPLCTDVGESCFDNCTSLLTIYIPSVNNIGGTESNDSVFNGIIGLNITLTVPSEQMTILGDSNPDGDIQYLIDNNTVNVIQV